MRVPYRKETDRLHDNSITLSHPLKQFQAWFEEAVTCPGLYEANAMVLSTVSKYLPTLFNKMLRSGRPSARYVLLKGLDDRGFHFYTNSVSQKGQDIVIIRFFSLIDLGTQSKSWPSFLLGALESSGIC